MMQYLHTFWGVFLFFLFVFTCYFFALLFYYTLGRKAFFYLFPIYKWWSNLWLWLTGFRLKVEGVEHFMRNPQCVMVGNHSSMLDMFTMASGVPHAFKTLAKKEIEKIPVVGLIFKLGCVHVDRQNPESRKKSVAKIKEEIELGYPILIMPEGTRNKSKHPLNPFKDGAFRVAIEMQKPLLPFVILHVRTFMPYPENILLKRGEIVLKFLPAISTQGKTLEQIESLKQESFQKIESVLLSEDRYFNKK